MFPTTTVHRRDYTNMKDITQKWLTDILGKLPYHLFPLESNVIVTIGFFK